MADVKIDGKLFQDRLSQLVNAWKADKRSADGGVFGGVSSIVVMMGKVEEAPEYGKNNAMHVSSWNLLPRPRRVFLARLVFMG